MQKVGHVRQAATENAFSGFGCFVCKAGRPDAFISGVGGITGETDAYRLRCSISRPCRATALSFYFFTEPGVRTVKTKRCLEGYFEGGM